jgi:dimeric dUTPase (all-alpha-NTP-PPase superfamily)
MNNKKIVLEEYVDGIHFLSTFINYFKIEPVFNITNLKIILDKRIITIEFNELFKLLAKIDFSKTKEVNASIFQKYIKKYILLGLGLNFSFNEIIEAYNNKYKINIKRQKSGTY